MRFSSYFRLVMSLDWTRSAMQQKGGSNFVKKGKVRLFSKLGLLV